MGYLVGEIWIWLLITFVIGLVIGWLIWGRGRAAAQSRITGLERQLATTKAQCDACEAEKSKLKAAAEAAESAKAGLEKELASAKSAAEASTSEVGRLSAKIADLEKAQGAAGSQAATANADAEEKARLEARIAELEKERDDAKTAAAAAPAAAATETVPAGGGSAAQTTSVDAVDGDDTVSLTDADVDLTGSGAPSEVSGDDAPTVSDADRPDSLAAPQGEKDDLKKISGVGPKLEGVLNELGVFHFWQIAKWTDREVAWVDDYLSFKGRINRDKWIEQAKVLADGGETEFSARAK